MLSLGVVGLPNVGKSALFNALTSSHADADNRPFSTVEKNIGIVEVPDPRLDVLGGIIKPKRVVPATVLFVDIAGLVSGSASGVGLGNEFVARGRETDALVHVIRCFEDPDVLHVMDTVDPVRDREIVQLELALADLAVVEKRLERVRRAAKSHDKDAVAAAAVLEKAFAALGDGLWLSDPRSGLRPTRPGCLTGFLPKNRPTRPCNAPRPPPAAAAGWWNA
jgi:GTP-binding protein YchF